MCNGQKDKFFSNLFITPILLPINYGDRYAHYGHRLTIHSDTLIVIDGESCEYIEKQIHECLGIKYPSEIVMDMCF
jgi:hypothetical protein